MLEMSKSVYKKAIQWVEDKITKNTGDQKYAVEFNSRILKVASEHGDKGCVESDFVPFFCLHEADLLHYVLTAMTTRGLLKREVRYFLRSTK